MPLIQGKSPRAFSKNVSTEMNSGKPQNQALAIAYGIKRKNKKASGGLITSDESLKRAADYELNKEAHSMSVGGEVESMNRLPKEELDHDEIIPHADQEDGYEGAFDMADSENLPENMSEGGLMDPKHMAVMIMKKKAHGAMAYSEGGLVNDGDEDLQGEEKQYVGVDRMPSNAYDEIEGSGEAREQMKRRAMLQGIMAGLHSSHSRGITKS